MTAQAGRRERRDGWAAKASVRINPERDPMICYALGRSKVLPTRDIALLAFGSRETARDRLRKLHCAGLVRAHVRDLATDNLYTLTERGRALAVEHLDADHGELVVVRTLPKQLDHLLGVNRVRVCLTVVSRGLSHDPLRAFVPDWELQAMRHAALVGLVPDAIARLRDARGEDHFIAIEVDTGSENPSYVAKKMVGYEQHILAGLPIYGAAIERVVLVAPGCRRLRSLARAFVASRVRIPVLFGDLATITPSSVLQGYASPTTLSAAAVGEISRLLVEPLLEHATGRACAP